MKIMKTNIEKLNDSNLNDFASKTDGEFRRQLDKDITYLTIENINWDRESQYHNTYYLGKGKYGNRTLKQSKNNK